MNYGVLKSKNKYLLYLNSGDYFVSENSLSQISKYIKNKKKNCYMFVSILKWKKDYFIPKKSTFFAKSFLTHNSFVRYPASNIRKFDIKKKITADGQWMIENIRDSNIKKKFIYFSIFTLGGISNYPSIKSLKMKMNLGLKIIFKEILKMIFLKIMGTKIFYRLIYSSKYKRVDLNEINLMN